MLTLLLVFVLITLIGFSIGNSLTKRAFPLDFWVQTVFLVLMLLTSFTYFIPLLLLIPFGVWQVTSALNYVLAQPTQRGNERRKLYLGLVGVFATGSCVYIFGVPAAYYTYFSNSWLDDLVTYTGFAMPPILGILYYGLTVKCYLEEKKELILETPRLVWRTFRPSDAAFILELLNSEGWIRFIGDRNVHTLEAAADYIDTRFMANYRAYGFAFLTVALNDAVSTPIGIAGFVKRGELEYPDFGFAFLPQYTGNGYALEIATALMPYAKEMLKMENLLAITTLDNEKSIALLEKLGFSFDKTIEFDGEELRLYAKEM